MIVSRWVHMGTVLNRHAAAFPDKLGCQDKAKSFTFAEWNLRARRLALALAGLNCGPGDRFAVLAYNRVEWMEIYAGCAKGGQVCVPIMFRSASAEIAYIVNNSGCKALICERSFARTIDSIRTELLIPETNYICISDGEAPPKGYIAYEEWLAGQSADEPDVLVDASKPWTIMYTSGTTGKPKGVVRTHESFMAMYYLHIANMGVRSTDKAMMVMPMCHVNSIFYSFPYTLLSAPVFVYNELSFDPEDFLETADRHSITFVSLVPTHYVMITSLPDEVKEEYNLTAIRQLLVSSAPARKSLKLAVMEFFPGAELWEAYGSTEAGLVTLCRPEDQMQKIGSIGREIFGVDVIKVLDEQGNQVSDGEVGELYARTPMLFKEYWNQPEKTAAAFRGEWFSAGDMCYRDEDGFYVLVDRKANMIITGGENVFPSEVEQALANHEAVKDVAVIGLPHEKWGEAIHAVVILRSGFEPSARLKEELRRSLWTKIARYKVPKSIDFVGDDDMPRTGAGKILHRKLREKYGG